MAAVMSLPRARCAPGESARIVGNETIKALQVMWSHRAVMVPQVAVMAVWFWVFQFFVGGGRIVDDLVAQTLFGFWAYVVGYLALLRMAAGVLEEKFTGTLEQSLLSPLPPAVGSLGRLVAVMTEGLVTALIASGVTVAVFTIAIPFRWEVLIPIVLTLVDLAGFALLIGGLALVVNSIGSIIHVIQSLLLLLNGAFIPIYAFPDWLQVVARFAPSTLGIDVIRRLLFAGDSLDAVWSAGQLPLTIVHAAVMFALGWAVYQGAIDRGLRDGRLGA
jgi:ABC-2 type transport system permease protein